MRDKIIAVENFPTKEVTFQDITPLLANAVDLRELVWTMTKENLMHDIVAGINARGFILGSIIAHEIGAGFVPIRKDNKLPRPVWSAEYDLEYGRAILDIHKDAIQENERVLLVDDVLATGGTAGAGVKLIRMCGGIVKKVAFAVEIRALDGRKKLEAMGVEVESVFLI